MIYRKQDRRIKEKGGGFLFFSPRTTVFLLTLHDHVGHIKDSDECTSYTVRRVVVIHAYTPTFRRLK